MVLTTINATVMDPIGRQIQLQQDQDQSQVDKDDGDKKIFGLFEGGNSCNCNAPSSVEFGPDCKGRLEGNQYYGCGCSNNSAGGLFTFGRRRRRRQINSPTSIIIIIYR